MGTLLFVFLSSFLITGFSLKLKDKRIDKTLFKLSYTNYTVYYSPLKLWFFGLGFVILISTAVFYSMKLWHFFEFLSNFEFIVLIITYILIGYLISSYTNNSFAVTNNELIVINPNFPFRKVNAYKLNEVSFIEINKDRSWFFTIIFGIFGGNYMKISNSRSKKKFYCFNLEVDSFDENMTEKTLDDFHRELKSKDVNVDLKI